MTTRSSIKTIIILTLISVLAASLALAATPNPSGDEHQKGEPYSKAFGKTLTEWMGTYWRWYYGTGSDLTQSKVGRVQLMPLPTGVQAGGTGTPKDPAVYVGQLEITLQPGTPFVLPLYSWLRERYKDWPGVPDDPPLSDAVGLASGHPKLSIDGETIITDANKAAFYVPDTNFNPILVYLTPSSSGSVAAISYQGVVFVSPPLTAGTHVIQLYVPLIIEAGTYVGLPDGLGIVYDNTWIVTVEHHKD
jgi:hypothetical protein